MRHGGAPDLLCRLEDAALTVCIDGEVTRLFRDDALVHMVGTLLSLTLLAAISAILERQIIVGAVLG